MRDFFFWLTIIILVAVASFEGGYIIAKKEDVWHDEGQYLNLKMRIKILEGEVFPSKRVYPTLPGKKGK